MRGEVAAKTVRRRVMDLPEYLDCSWMSPQKVADQIGVKRQNTIAALSALLDEGEVERNRYGQYRKIPADRAVVFSRPLAKSGMLALTERVYVPMPSGYACDG